METHPQRSGPITKTILPIAIIALAFALAFGITRHFRNAGNGSNSTRPGSQLVVGSTAPDFTLKDAHTDSDGNDLTDTLSQITDKQPVLLIFFLSYNCPRCTAHLREIADRIDQFNQQGIRVLAISPSTSAETRDAIHAFGDLPFPLLADTDYKVARAYNLTERTDGTDLLHGAFLIDTNRKIVFLDRAEHPYDNVDDFLNILKKDAAPRK